LALPAQQAQQAPQAQQSQSNQPPAPPETKPEDLCTVEGQVTNQATGAPIRKAEIMLHGTERPTAGAMPATYSATADAGGNFIIKDVEPGKYRLSAQHSGFVSLQYGARGNNRGGTTLTLGTGQRLKDLSLRMAPQAVITGRVVDEKNEPVASASVSTMRYSYMMGKKQLMQMGGGVTNDLGEYRIYGLAPGRYYLAAKELRDDWEATVDASATPQVDGYVNTYYPATTDPTAAMLIDVGPGVQLRGVNITLAKARTFRVRGRVEGRHDSYVSFMARGQARWMAMDSVEHATDQKGNFEIEGVLPGAYTLSATVWSDQKAMSARQDVDVGENDVDNIVLVLAGGSPLSGRVAVESGTPPNLDSVTVFLQPQDQTRQMSGSLYDHLHDGAFTMTDVPPENYRLRVMGLPDGYWVKSIRMGDQEAKETGLDLTRGPGDTVTVTIAPNAPQIDGAVMNDKQQPAAGVTVVLVPEPKLRENQDAYKTATSDQNGRFSLKNLDPGDYKLFAWEEVEYGAYMDPDFLRPLEDRGQSISIQEGSHESVQLNAIAADSAPATQKEK
jgi:hypothetical protein